MSGVKGGADLHVDVAVKDHVNVKLDVNVNVYVADHRPWHDELKGQQDGGSGCVAQLGVEPRAEAIDLTWT